MAGGRLMAAGHHDRSGGRITIVPEVTTSLI